ncbi:MAG: hypothetical protein EAZ30_16580 [Betaproteobacteria bacterium]|nr:MAG: hypothetical protein EAZ30_16580 [Betaproteobacteria bacterium]
MNGLGAWAVFQVIFFYCRSWFDGLTTNGEGLTTNGKGLTTNGKGLTTNGKGLTTNGEGLTTSGRAHHKRGARTTS